MCSLDFVTDMWAHITTMQNSITTLNNSIPNENNPLNASIGYIHAMDVDAFQDNPNHTEISVNNMRLGGRLSTNSVDSGKIRIDAGSNTLRIIGARRQGNIGRVLIDGNLVVRGSTTTTTGATVTGTTNLDVLEANSVGEELKTVIENTTRNEIGARPRFNDYQPQITEPTAINARLVAAKDDYSWHDHFPSDITRVSARGMQFGNQLDKGYDHSSGSITSSEYVTESLCIMGCGSIGNH